MTAEAAGWRATFAVYAHPRVRTMLLLGFSSGLPFPLVLTTLSARLRQAGIDRATIGYFSLVGLAYSLKYFWSPVVDRLPLPLLHRAGRRRSWMLLAQICVIGGLALMALCNPETDASGMAWLAVFTAFAAATQDIAVDAWRIEAVEEQWQGAMAAAYQMGYQLALICAGAGALVAAAARGWSTAYLLMASIMLIGPLTVVFTKEPGASVRTRADYDEHLLERTLTWLRPGRLLATVFVTILLDIAAYSLGLEVPATANVVWKSAVVVVDFISVASGVVSFGALVFLVTGAIAPLRPIQRWLVGAIVLPFVDLSIRNGLRNAVFILALVICYRLNYTTMGVAANTFYLDLGYTLADIALVSKGYGIAVTLAGALLAGLLVRRMGLPRTMLTGVLLLSAANLVYAAIAQHLVAFAAAHARNPATAPHPDLLWLALAVSLDNLGNGIAGTAFIAYMSSLVNIAYTATQYALFGTLWSLPAKSLASQWGRIVDTWGYPTFFIYTAALGIPAAILILKMMRQPPLPAIAAKLAEVAVVRVNSKDP